MPSESHPLPAHKLRIKKLRSLLAMAENAVKSDNYLFRNLYAEENGKEIDILEGGLNSCAVFVSFILLALELIKHPHAAVFSTEKDLIASGWYEIKELKPGAVIVWEKLLAEEGVLGEKNLMESHLGFYAGNNEAISNLKKEKIPIKHHITYGVKPDGSPVRKIEKIYWHKDLDNG